MLIGNRQDMGYGIIMSLGHMDISLLVPGCILSVGS